ncbi:helix-hairpin-helix domain-containing protein [Olivibacter sp. SDN3]|uniref:ComEA family DNA-binding protein n=1 Tax=Olivibacter sp. SDN3 TaxID=2764720 RepID=UPI0016513E34|nr:helix-hairpin-helix domain-containing protein [Olivibacter sp. SDN3]QNL49158.1 helix-hairpin-helix domain-containing protein [Olivibacter sp. SDN3]
MLFKYTLATLFLSLCCYYTCAQTNDLLIEQLVESMVEELGEDFDYTELTEKLNYYRIHPINLNKTDGRELTELRILSPMQVSGILEHRRTSGDYITIYELQAVKDLGLNIIRLLLPFVKVDEISALKGADVYDYLREGKHDLMMRYGRVIGNQLGYTIQDSTRSRYLGSPSRLFVRYRYQYTPDFRLSLNMKKDPGEQFFAGAQPYGFDFYSGSIYLGNQKRWKHVVLGDYAMQFGQGLALWTGLSFGKGALVQHMARQGGGLQPYTSTNEFSFFRGLAATYSLKKIAFTPFVSYKKLTATLQEEGENGNKFSALGQNGLHRTPSEVANKHNLGEFIFGANAQYQTAKLTLGSTIYQTHFDGELSPRPQLYNAYFFRGQQLTNTSIYYNYNVMNLYIFGEFAHSLGTGIAYTNGIIATLSHQFSLVLQQRNYQRDYHAFYNQAIAEGSNAVNEAGFYTGLIFQPSRAFQWVGYADYFKFPWLRYRVDAPSDGVDLFSQITYTPNKQTRYALRYRYRGKSENGQQQVVNFLENVVRQQCRAEVQYSFHETIRMRNRAEVVQYKKDRIKEYGYLIYQDIIYAPLTSSLSGNMRFALFNTDSYQSRIYAFESDVLYAYSFPLYSNKGFRYYLNLRYKVARGIDLWCRYASFRYDGVDYTGTGLDRLEGNHKPEVKLQIRCRF